MFRNSAWSVKWEQSQIFHQRALNKCVINSIFCPRSVFCSFFLSFFAAPPSLCLYFALTTQHTSIQYFIQNERCVCAARRVCYSLIRNVFTHTRLRLTDTHHTHTHSHHHKWIIISSLGKKYNRMCWVWLRYHCAAGRECERERNV